jgi:hypothetical protein
MESPVAEAFDRSHTAVTTANPEDFYIQEYFVRLLSQQCLPKSGPMDPLTYSPFPYFLRLRGSVLPKMIIPLLFVAGWSTMITCISHFVWSLAVNP